MNNELPSIDFNQSLVDLPNGGKMPEREFQALTNIMDYKPIDAIAPRQETKQLSGFNLNISPQIIIAGMLTVAGLFMGSLMMIKVYGTTDVAQQYENRRQLDEIGKRYDRLAELAEKASERPNVCISFYCGGNGETKATQRQFTEPTPTVNSPKFPSAMREVASWKLSGVNRSQAFQQLGEVKNPDEREILYQAIVNIYED